jgi:hypothetical protein
MKAVFGVFALVVVLALVAMVAKRQVQSAGNVVATGLPGALAVEASAPELSQHTGATAERARTATERALQQGAQRNQRADP